MFQTATGVVAERDSSGLASLGPAFHSGDEQSQDSACSNLTTRGIIRAKVDSHPEPRVFPETGCPEEDRKSFFHSSATKPGRPQASM